MDEEFEVSYLQVHPNEASEVQSQSGDPVCPEAILDIAYPADRVVPQACPVWEPYERSITGRVSIWED